MSVMQGGNLFAGLRVPAEAEVFEDLLVLPLAGGAGGGRVRIERICSSARVQPVLYDQSQDEWVLLLQGRARLWVAGTETVLGPGDYLFIPAHTPHRVLETSDTPPCLWLAVHVHGDDGGGVRPGVLDS